MTCHIANEGKIKGKKFDAVVVVGMGGSGLTGDILKFIKDDIGLSVPVFVSKDYTLPKTEAKKPLFIFSSFSGNTHETITALREALKQKKDVAVVTSGGVEKIIAEKHSLPLGVFETQNLTPREGLIYNLSTIITLLSFCFPIREIDMSPKRIGSTKYSNDIVKKIGTRIPLIYTDNSTSSLGLLWKIFFNESAKIPAFSNTIPEVAHNEIEGITHTTKLFIPLFLTSKKTTKENKTKIQALVGFFKKKNISPILVKLDGTKNKDIFINAFAHITLLTNEIAKSKKISPQHTPSIDLFKKEFEK
ncbi:MAG: SIS domain-containing protein [Patescibacteria group bacterium]